MPGALELAEVTVGEVVVRVDELRSVNQAIELRPELQVVPLPRLGMSSEIVSDRLIPLDWNRTNVLRPHKLPFLDDGSHEELRDFLLSAVHGLVNGL